MWLPTGPYATQVDYESIKAVTITGSVTSHTKGSWTQLVATAPFDVMGFGIFTDATSVAGTNTAILLDIGIGASASEIVLVPDILAGSSAIARSGSGGGLALFPIYIASGTRISARLQGAVSSETADVSLLLYGGGSWQQQTFQAVDAIGVNGATSTGVSLASAGIQEVIGSTAEPYKALGSIVDTNGDASMGTASEIINLFVGAAAAEIALTEGQLVERNASEFVALVFPSQGFIPVEFNIPAGSRLSAESETGSNTIGIAMYGFR